MGQRLDGHKKLVFSTSRVYQADRAIALPLRGGVGGIWCPVALSKEPQEVWLDSQLTLLLVYMK